MKKILAILLLLVCLYSAASAEAPVYINNPNPNHRLHLRVSPDISAKSLGKYYNGAPVTLLDSSLEQEWAYVRIGEGKGSLAGYMKTEFLSDIPSPDNMPQFAASRKFTAYTCQDTKSSTVSVSGGQLVSLMGFTDDWWHLSVQTGTSEGNYYCFVPADCPWMTDFSHQTVNVYISNPNSKDRLHLREQPSIASKSLGKYYNGCIAKLTGFAEDGNWVKVDLYGRIGYMKREFVYIEGQGQNPTYYGIPTVQTSASGIRLYQSLLKDPSESIMLSSANEVEVLGLVDDHTLHVRWNEKTWFVDRAKTSFKDIRYFKDNR